MEFNSPDPPLTFDEPGAELMVQQVALAMWETWVANQYFKANQSVPDREMLEALRGCVLPARQADLEVLDLANGLTIGETATELLRIHYPRT
jgi:hypothetical protein